MKRIALFGVVVMGVGLANGALASDLPVWAAPVYQAPVAIAPTWTGFYLGFNAGWGWTGKGDTKFKFSGAIDSLPHTETMSSPVIGGQFGYNWQTGSWVWGIEADVDGSHLQANHTAMVPTIGTAFLNERQEWLASGRFRAGYIWGPGMIYFTAGMAWSRAQIDGGATVFGGGGASNNFSISQVRSGTVVGTGYEWMIAPNWSARAEMLWYKFTGTTTGTVMFPAAGTTVAAGTTKFDTVIARLGLDYKFDWAAPLATRY
jgi:outer membrane immunogenic protein